MGRIRKFREKQLRTRCACIVWKDLLPVLKDLAAIQKLEEEQTFMPYSNLAIYVDWSDVEGLVAFNDLIIPWVLFFRIGLLPRPGFHDSVAFLRDRCRWNHKWSLETTQTRHLCLDEKFEDNIYRSDGLNHSRNLVVFLKKRVDLLVRHSGSFLS